MSRAGLAVLALVGLAAGATAALAHGGTLQLVKAAAGPYLVSVWTRPDPPRTGQLHVSVVVMRPGTEDAVLDARVELRARPPGDGPAPAVSLARGAHDNPLLHEGDVELHSTGLWRVTLAVSGPAGAGEAAFDLDVRPPRSVLWSLAPAGAAVVAILGWFLARTRRRRRPGAA